ncbi:Rne/Rng family ribonuclease [Nisaea nitritireducens]|uniref:Rne/Rng family ribonuclease n=1 Tax=Nisaea nitritireducens TaxID=568392 RepID=UPI001866BECC|nr:ribonuclease E/G [Nisaea nitritireducens]
MSKSMLIDATQAEETRVVLLSGNRVEDFDFETESRKQLKGNIYLARVTRVEPSLQAAFVEYGGNRHGFLAFSEIHPDYYRIPVEDREALLAEERAEDEVAAAAAAGEDVPAPTPEERAEARASHATGDEDEDGPPAPPPESIGGDDTDGDDDDVRPRKNISRRYKIQEVITRRQIMLVQVVKEERGNKGAALTTYLSLAGRYCVLMPNTARGGGVSRKITNIADRKRLKQIVEGLELPEGMAVIVRTAGSQRTKTEIKRDYEYLLRLWDQIREKTLTSSAPCLIYEEANLIKRSIRDLYTRDIDEVLVEGEDGYRIAKDFMRTLVPSHAKRVQPYKEQTVPLFHRYQIEGQLDAIHNPVVQLKSGGYLVMSQTEALVAVDVNSGRATRERNIEETALKTNLEAADEVARQLRLRDMAGLVVIDFIDMDEPRNQHAVERRMKDAMKNDRARIQLGRISHFGLMELSRQRLRPSVFEASTQVCVQCAGSGRVRSTDSTALHVLRAIEEEGIKQKASEIAVFVPSEVGFYILNKKRDALATIEERYGFRVFLEADDSLVPPDMRIERMLPKSASERIDLAAPIVAPHVEEDDEEVEIEADAEEQERDEERRPKRSRRRRRRGGEKRAAEQQDQGDSVSEEAKDAEQSDEEKAAAADGEAATGDDEDGNKKRRRRGKRGGRRRSRRGNGEEGAAANENGEGVEQTGADASEGQDSQVASSTEQGEQADAVTPEVTEAPAKVEDAAPDAVPVEAAASAEAPAVEEEKPKRKPRARRKKVVEAEAAPAPAAESDEKAEKAEEKPAKPRRRSRAKKAVAAEAVDEAPKEDAAPVKETPAAAAEEVSSGNGSDKIAETASPEPEKAPDDGNTVVDVDSPAKEGKTRRGWWNRLIPS